LRICSYCSKGPSGGIPLKKCGGCILPTTFYCNKTCQRADWASKHKSVEHRRTCDYVTFKCDTTDARERAHALRVSPATPFQDFARAHEWTLERICRAHILLKGKNRVGISRQLENNSEALVLHFRPTPDSRSGRRRNPASGFELADHGFRNVQGEIAAGRGTEAAYANILDEMKTLNERLLGEGRGDYVGLAPVLYVVDGVPGWMRRPVPVYLPGFVVRDDFTKVALIDFLFICSHTLRDGLPLRCADPCLTSHAVPGRFKREDDGWTWQALFTSWDDYD
ncbi:hypothetical protein C8Q77DRAFT_1014944, partial [Trametes polyzona]